MTGGGPKAATDKPAAVAIEFRRRRRREVAPRKRLRIRDALGALGADFPRELIVETSVDGSTWQPAWQGSPATAVLRAALESPLSTRASLVFPPRAARYVRLRQVGRHEVNYWSIAGLEVWSGR